MPGSLTSMPNSAVPLTLAGVSSRLVRLPTMRNSLGILERHLLGHRQLRRRGGELAVGRLLAARADDPCRFRPSGVERSTFHLVGGSRDQHLAHLRAGDAQLLPAVAHRGRAAGELRAAEQRVAVQLGVGRRDRHLDRAGCRRSAPRRSASASRCRRPGPSRSAPRSA